MIRECSSNSRLRVVHVVGQLDIGGMEKLLVEFAQHADRARFDLHFISLTTRGALADEIEALGWPVTTLEERSGFRPGMIVRIARLLRHFRTRVLHAHNTRPLIYGAPAARLAGVPVVISTRHGQSYGVGNRHQAAFRLASTLASRVVCVSRDSLQLSAQRGIPRLKLSTIWNGIDTSTFAYSGPQANGPVVFVGRLAPEKDVASLLRAVALIVPQEPLFRLEVAGDGACLPELRALATHLGLDAHVKFLGAVRDVPALLGRASLFVLPSLTEGISLTLLEAMARGIPVVTTRVGGNVEVVVDGETGLLIPPEDPEKLATAIRQVRHDPEAARCMGLKGRRRVEMLFDVRQTVAAYEDLYARQLARRRLSPA